MGNSRSRQNRDALRAAMEASAKEAPIPVGWDEVTTDKGVKYYIDYLHQTTTFMDPRFSPSQMKRNKKDNKKKGKPPNYEITLYTRSQNLLAKLHKEKHDDGHIEMIVSRDNLFEDSFNFFTNCDVPLTRRLFVKFEGEEGLDYGGMSRELLLSLSMEFMKPELFLFTRTSDGYEFSINRYSSRNNKHLNHFGFFGTVMGIAIYHNKLFATRFSLPFYKQVLGKKEEFSDLKYVDKDIYRSMKKIRDAKDINSWELDFSILDKDENGKPLSVELKKGGEEIPVTNENKEEYISLVMQHYLNSTKQQMDAIKASFQKFCPLDYIQDFEPLEFEQILCGTQQVDKNDLKANTEYGEGFNEATPVIKLFWEIFSTFQEEEIMKFLQFTTGTTKIPVGGFAHLYGSNGPQKLQICPKKVAGLPTAHSCFNRLELPNYTEKEKLKKELLLAITETSGFGLE